MGRARWLPGCIAVLLVALLLVAAGRSAPPARAASAQSDYWLVGGDGAVFPFGSAANHGSLAGKPLAKPVVGAARTPAGKGYWLVASDGGIFSFGDAAFHGSTGATKLNQPIEGMAATPSGGGYWLVARDGGIFAFGDADFHGSTGATKLNQPIAGMAPTVGGDGYWLVAGDGGIFAFGTAGYSGSTASQTLKAPIVVLLPAPPGPTSLLDQLRIASEGARGGYDRDLFKHWVDADGNGCDTRQEVLMDEDKAPNPDTECPVTSGLWVSLYDNVQTNDPSTLDIDHMVPLAEAWDSGAAGWDADKRKAFANDLGYPGSLVAVTASSNRSKSDQDPAEWKPPTQGFWCDYATWRTTVKVRWSLSADRAEVDALRSMLNTCASGGGGTTTTTTAPPPVSGVGFGTMQCDAPGAPDDASNINEEWVELVNTDPAPADVGSWTVSDDAANTYTVPAGFTLANGATVTLHTGSGTNTQTDLYWGRTQHVWNNDGDTAYLRNTNGTQVTTRAC